MTAPHGKHEARELRDKPAEEDSIEAGNTEADETEADGTGPALTARGLSLRGSRGWVFRDIDLQVAAGETVLLIGPAGTGRSCLLLAMTGRMAGATGALTVAGHDLDTEPRLVRARTAVARISDVVVPEPSLTIAESVVERSLLDGVKVGAGRLRFDAAASILGLDVSRDMQVEELTAAEQTALALALAFVAPADLVVLDDVDRGLGAEGLQQLCARMLELTADGTAIVATALQPPGDPTGLTVVTLTPATGSDPR